MLVCVSVGVGLCLVLICVLVTLGDGTDGVQKYVVTESCDQLLSLSEQRPSTGAILSFDGRMSFSGKFYSKPDLNLICQFKFVANYSGLIKPKIAVHFRPDFYVMPPEKFDSLVLRGLSFLYPCARAQLSLCLGYSREICNTNEAPDDFHTSERVIRVNITAKYLAPDSDTGEPLGPQYQIRVFFNIEFTVFDSATTASTGEQKETEPPDDTGLDDPTVVWVTVGLFMSGVAVTTVYFTFILYVWPAMKERDVLGRLVVWWNALTARFAGWWMGVRAALRSACGGKTFVVEIGGSGGGRGGSVLATNVAGVEGGGVAASSSNRGGAAGGGGGREVGDGLAANTSGTGVMLHEPWRWS